MFEGKWYHSVLENLLKDQNQKPEDTMQSIASYCPQDLPYFDHKHSFEKSKEIVSRAIDFYLNQKPEYWIIQWVEETYEMEILPWLPKLKGVIDVIGERWNDVFLYDHKLTISIVNQEDMSPSYELQAWSYFTLYEKATGAKPKAMIFEQCKKTKNRDGSPQIVNYTVLNTETIRLRFEEVYRRVCMELSGKIAPLPNPFDPMSNGDSWRDFCQEVDEQYNIPIF